MDVIARADSDQDAAANGAAVGAVAAQLNYATATSDVTTESFVGENVNIVGDGGAIGGLEDGQQYYIVKSQEFDVGFDEITQATGFVGAPSIPNVGNGTPTIFHVGANHGLKTGDKVNTRPKGLDGCWWRPIFDTRGENGQEGQILGAPYFCAADVFYVIVVEGTTDRIQLARAREHAEKGFAVGFEFVSDLSIIPEEPRQVRLSASPPDSNPTAATFIDLTTANGAGHKIISTENKLHVLEFNANDVVLSEDSIILSDATNFRHGQIVTFDRSDGPAVAIKATAHENTLSEAEAGQGSLAGAQAATAKSISLGETKAYILGASNNADEIESNDITIRAQSVEVRARHESTVDGDAENTIVAVVGLSDARFLGSVDTEASATVGEDVHIVANSVTVDSLNRSEKPESKPGDYNAQVSAGSVASSTEARSETNIKHQSSAHIGDNAKIEVVGDLSSTFQVNAQNELVAHDTTRNTTVGAGQLTKVTSVIRAGDDETEGAGDNVAEISDDNPFSSIASVGRGAEITTSGDLVITAGGDAIIVSKPSGLAAGGASKAKLDGQAIVHATNDVVVGSDAALTSMGEMRLWAGRAAAEGVPEGVEDRYFTKVDGDQTNASLLASSDATGKGEVINKNFVEIKRDASVRSARSASIVGEKTPTQTADTSASSTGFLLAGALTGQENETEANLSVQSGVIIDGTVEVGIHRQQSLTIPADVDVDKIQEELGDTAPIKVQVTLESIGNRLIDLKKRFEELIVDFGGDPAAVAAYENEIRIIDERMRDLGLERDVPLLDENGEPVLDNDGNPVTRRLFNEGAVVPTITLEPIHAQAGTINIEGHKLLGSGDLIAPNGTSVSVVNRSPANLYLTSIHIPSAEHGKLIFNGKEISENSDVDRLNEQKSGGEQPDFDRIAVGGSDTRLVDIASEFSGNAELPAADVRVVGTKIIENGVVVGSRGIENRLGRTKIDGEGQVLVEESLVSGELEILAGSFVLLVADRDKDGVPDVGVHVGQAPIVTLDETRKIVEVWDGSSALTTSETDANWGQLEKVQAAVANGQSAQQQADAVAGILAFQRVAISAPFINVNAPIVAGSTLRSTTIHVDQATIDGYEADFANGGGPLFKIQQPRRDIATTLSDGKDIDIVYNAALDRFEVEDVTTRSGRIDLFGRIINTSNGSLTAFDGPGQVTINVTSDANLPVVINSIDTRSNSQGIIRLVDSGRSGETATGRPLVTEYTRDENGKIATVTYELPTMIGQEQKSDPVVSEDEDNVVYQPKQGVRYHFQTGLAGSTIVDTLSAKKTANFGFFEIDSLAADSGDIEKQTTEIADINGDGIPDLRPIALSSGGESVGEYVNETAGVLDFGDYEHSYAFIETLTFSSRNGNELQLDRNYPGRNASQVIFRKGSGQANGLVDGKFYFIVLNPNDRSRIGLATSVELAEAGTADVALGTITGPNGDTNTHSFLEIRKLKRWEERSGFLNWRKEYWLHLVTEDPFKKVYTHTFEADKPIKINLPRFDEGAVTIATPTTASGDEPSPPNILIQGSIQNSGTTTITTEGSIESISDLAVVKGTHIDLKAGSNIAGENAQGVDFDNPGTSSSKYVIHYRSNDFGGGQGSVSANDYITASVSFNSKPEFPGVAEPSKFTLMFHDEDGDADFAITVDNPTNAHTVEFDEDGDVLAWVLTAATETTTITSKFPLQGSKEDLVDGVGTGSIFLPGDWKDVPQASVTTTAAGPALRIDLIDSEVGGLNVMSESGDIVISETEGDLVYDNIMTEGTLSLTADGSIIARDQPGDEPFGDTAETTLLQAPTIELIAQLGSIGTMESLLLLDTGSEIGQGCAAISAAGVFLEEQTGDLQLVRAHTSQNSDVAIEVPNGSLIDGNASVRRDDLTDEQKLDLQRDLGAIGPENDQIVANAIQSYENTKTGEYFEYWTLRAEQPDDPITILDPETGEVVDLAVDVNYYVIVIDADTVRIANSLEDANNGANIEFDLEDVASGKFHQLHYGDPELGLFDPVNDVDTSFSSIRIEGHGLSTGDEVVYHSSIYDPDFIFEVSPEQADALEPYVREHELERLREEEDDPTISPDDPRVDDAVSMFFAIQESEKSDRYHQLHQTYGGIGNLTNDPGGHDPNQFDPDYQFTASYDMPGDFGGEAVQADGTTLDIGVRIFDFADEVIFNAGTGSIGNLTDGEVYYVVPSETDSTLIQLSEHDPSETEPPQLVDISGLTGEGHWFSIQGTFETSYESLDVVDYENDWILLDLNIYSPGQPVKLQSVFGEPLDDETVFFVVPVDDVPNAIYLALDIDDLENSIADLEPGVVNGIFEIVDGSFLTEETSFTEEQILYAVDASVFEDDAPSEAAVEANIIGRNVSLIVSGDVGANGGTVVINLPAENLTPEQIQALALAEAGDITYFDDFDGQGAETDADSAVSLVIDLMEDFDIAASGEIADDVGGEFLIEEVPAFVDEVDPDVDGDFDGDGFFGCGDIAMLQDAFRAGGFEGEFDVNGDGAINQADVEEWVIDIAGSLLGDATLDGIVDAIDLNKLGVSWLQSHADIHWCQGDFDSNGTVDAIDLNKVGVNWLQESDGIVDPPVEPTEPTGDFNGDEILGCFDIAAMQDAVRDGNQAVEFDLNQDGVVDSADVDFWVSDFAITIIGDANLDGTIDAIDLNKLGVNWLQDHDGIHWCEGDFDNNNTVDAIDLNKVGLNWLKQQAPRSVRAPQAALAIASPSADDFPVGHVGIRNTASTSAGISNLRDSRAKNPESWRRNVDRFFASEQRAPRRQDHLVTRRLLDESGAVDPTIHPFGDLDGKAS